MRRSLLLCLLALLLFSCGEEEEATVEQRYVVPEAESVDLRVPIWAKHAIWYQIFVERFRNGDPSNDPTVPDLEGTSSLVQPAGWTPTPWGHDWYAQEDWASATGKDFYDAVSLRRYGGDLQGVLDRLDYLQELGVNALYVNPINNVPSSHSDARTYRHIASHFGPDPQGDEALIASETPTDPAIWQWTAADSLFLQLINEVHRRGMRIIMDVAWHLMDGDKQDGENDNFDPDVKQHIFRVTHRWLDPNDDGDPSDGVDGFRIDGAEQVPLGFWREYRRFVRSVHPQAFLVGDIWQEQGSETMYDVAPWLQGDVFDAVIQYRWYKATRSFFADAPPHLTASQYLVELESIQEGIPYDTRPAFINLTASHNTPRFSTSIYNPGRYDEEANPRDNSEYKLDKPDERTQQIQRLILVQQFTHVGAPHIWNGDEVGMWGADDPDNRKPLVWADLTYENETALPFGATHPPDPVKPDTALFNFYKRLIGMRNGHPYLFVEGKMHPMLADDERGIVVYERVYGDQHAIVSFNVSGETHEVTVPAQDGYYNNFLQPGETLDGADTGGTLVFSLAPLEAKLWFLE